MTNEQKIKDGFRCGPVNITDCMPHIVNSALQMQAEGTAYVVNLGRPDLPLLVVPAGRGQR